MFSSSSSSKYPWSSLWI